MAINVFFLHIRHLIPLKRHYGRVTRADENMVNDLHYKGIEFIVSKRVYSKIEQKNNICINVFCYENDLLFPVHI